MQSCQGSGDGGGAVSILQVRKLRLRDVKALDQGHTASRWQSRDGNLGSSSLPIFPPLVCQSPGAPWCPGSSSSLHRPLQDWELLGGCSQVCHLRGFPDHLLLSTVGAASLDLSSKMMTRIHPPFPVPRVPAWCRGFPTAPGAGNSDLLSFVQEETEAPGGEGTCSRSHSWWWQSWEGRAGPPTHGP